MEAGSVLQSPISYVPLELNSEIFTPHFNLSHSVKPLIDPTEFSQTMLWRMFKGRLQTEILILIPVLQEEPIYLQKTLDSIQNNIKKGNIHQSVVVVIIYEGWQNFKTEYDKSSFCKFFDKFVSIPKLKTSMRNAQIEGLKHEHDIMHVFMSITRLEKENNPEFSVLFCIKNKRESRLHTHLWFFYGLCHNIDPKYILLLTPGASPKNQAIHELYSELESNQNIGAVTGSIKPKSIEMFNFIVSAQNMEYKLMHIFEYTMADMLGQMIYLPESFTMVRWSSIAGPPLRKIYFKALKEPHMGMIEANFFYSYERVLPYTIFKSQEITHFRSCSQMKYVPSAVCKVLVPDNMLELFKTKHCQINGACCALIKYFKDYGESENTGFFYKMIFMMQGFWAYLNLLIVWFWVGILGITFMLTIKKAYPSLPNEDSFNILDYITLFYYSLVVITLIICLGTSSKESMKTFYTISVLWRILIFALLVLFGYNLTDSVLNNPEYLMVLAAIGLLFLLITTIYDGWKEVIFCLVPFILMLPTYINILCIYSMCNIHDCTFSKDPKAVTALEKKQKDERSKDRALIICGWCFSNCMFIYTFIKLDEIYGYTYVYSYGITGVLLILILVKFAFALAFKLKRAICDKPKPENFEMSSMSGGRLIDNRTPETERFGSNTEEDEMLQSLTNRLSI